MIPISSPCQRKLSSALPPAVGDIVVVDSVSDRYYYLETKL